MPKQIRSGTDVAATRASELVRGIEDYRSFRLCPFSTQIPGAAAHDHDGRLAGLCRRALEAYAGAVTSDADAVRILAGSLEAVDRGMAQRLQGR